MVDIGAVDEFAVGVMKAVEVEGKGLLVANVEGIFYVADDRCPHMGSRLSRGTLDRTVVTCPWHGSRFDLSDGRVVRWTDRTGAMLKLMSFLKRPASLRTYRVEPAEGRLLVELD
jgi:3-phenylpropionate/trans-cinnamate dioxygenase ferredoxin subunit